MTVHFIGAGPGAPDLITVRGLRLIQSCPVCLYAGSLVPEEIVKAAPQGARVVDTAPLTLDEIIAEVEAAHARGEHVARVHSGDPSLYGAIAEQIRRLERHGCALIAILALVFEIALSVLRLSPEDVGGHSCCHGVDHREDHEPGDEPSKGAPLELSVGVLGGFHDEAAEDRGESDVVVKRRVVVDDGVLDHQEVPVERRWKQEEEDPVVNALLQVKYSHQTTKEKGRQRMIDFQEIRDELIKIAEKYTK